MRETPSDGDEDTSVKCGECNIAYGSQVGLNVGEGAIFGVA